MKKLAIILATGFGTGFSPKAPGTAGSLVGVLLWFVTLSLPLWAKVLCAVFIFAVSVWSSQQACLIYQTKDDQRVVIDEIAGQYISLLGVTTWPFAIIGFLLFRVLDIVKLYPADWIDQHMQGGWGVVLDDIVSGYYTWVLMMLINYLWLNL